MTTSVSPASLLEVDLLLTPQRGHTGGRESVDRGASSPSRDLGWELSASVTVRLGAGIGPAPPSFSSPGPMGPLLRAARSAAPPTVLQACPTSNYLHSNCFWRSRWSWAA